MSWMARCLVLCAPGTSTQGVDFWMLAKGLSATVTPKHPVCLTDCVKVCLQQQVHNRFNTEIYR